MIGRSSATSGVARPGAQAIEIDADAGGGGPGAFREGGVEDDRRVGGNHQPGVVRQLPLQLAGAPAGVAEGDIAVPGALVAGDVEDDVLGRGDGDVRGDLQGGLPVAGGVLVEHEAPLPLHRTAGQQRPAADVLDVFEVEFLEHAAHGHADGMVDDEPHGALLAVIAEVDHRLGKMGIAKAGHGQQQVVFESGKVLSGHHRISSPGPVDTLSIGARRGEYKAMGDYRRPGARGQSDPVASPWPGMKRQVRITSIRSAATVRGMGANGAARRTMRTAAWSSTRWPELLTISTFSTSPSRPMATASRSSPNSALRRASSG